MPQLRTFSGFASTPNVGSAIVGAAGVAQRAEEARMQAANERARIAQQAAIANMEMQSKQQALQMQMLKEQQELEVQKAYQDAQLGLRERDIALQERKIGDEIAQAANLSSSRMAMQREVERLMSPAGGGMKAQDAFRQAIMTHGASADLPGTAYSDVIDSGQGAISPEIEMGQIYNVPGQPGYKYGRTGPNSIQYFKPEREAAVPEEVEWDPSKIKVGTRYFPKPAATEADRLEKEANDISKRMASADYAAHRQSMSKATDPDAKLSIGDKNRIKEYKDQQAELKKILDKIESLRSSFTNAPSVGGTNAIRILNIRQK